MYTPPHFTLDDRTQTIELIKRYPFALIITYADGNFETTHAPCVVSDDANELIIRFHLARANPHVKPLTDGQKTLVVFNGPHAYVSPDWYGPDNPNAVPTWNYAVVHATGVPTILDDTGLVTLLEQLSAENEDRLRPKKPWTSDKMDERAYQNLRRGIIGFEMTVSELQAKAKMGQNRSSAQRHGVKQALNGHSDTLANAVAEMVSN